MEVLQREKSFWKIPPYPSYHCLPKEIFGEEKIPAPPSLCCLLAYKYAEAAYYSRDGASREEENNPSFPARLELLSSGRHGEQHVLFNQPYSSFYALP